ncbi:MAG: pilus assembly protein [Bryobacteraceae bacterium]
MRWHRGRRRGSVIIDSVFTLLVFQATLIGIIDFGQLLFTHQAMVDRVRQAVRQGAVRPWDGSGDQIANLVLYGQATAPLQDGQDVQTPTFMQMRRENVRVVRAPGTAENPNDERLEVSIVNYEFQFFSPWIAGKFVNNYAVRETAPFLWRD